MKIFVFSFIAFVAVCSQALAANSSSVETSLRYILKNKAGNIYRVSASISQLSVNDFKRLGVNSSQGCVKIKESEHLQLSLELKTLMVHLSLRSEPKTLTKLEKQTLAQVPLCGPFLPMLKVLSQIISGDEYIGEKEITLSKNY